MIFIEEAEEEEPRGGNRGGNTTPAGEVLNKHHEMSSCRAPSD
jgi:hypothetical protein